MIDKTIKNNLDELYNNIPRAIVLISKNNKKIYSLEKGNTNTTLDSKLNLDTPFFIHSLSRIFISLSFLLVYDKYNLDMNMKIGEYLRQYPNYKDVTIKDLFYQTSGITDYYTHFGMELYKEKDNMNIVDFEINKELKIYETANDNAIRDFLSKEKLEFEPGKKIIYSSSNYFIMKELIEAVTSKSYELFVTESIISPLKLSNTSFHKAVDMELKMRVLNSKETYKSSDHFLLKGNFFDIASSANDLAILLNSFMNSNFVSPKALKMLKKTNREGMTFGFFYDMGLYNTQSFSFGNELFVGINFSKKIVAISLMPEHTLNIRKSAGIYDYFSNLLIKQLILIGKKKEKLKLVKVNEKNGWDGLNIEIHEYQEEFISNPLQQYAYSFINKKNVTQFLLIAKDICIGLLSLEVNKKENTYWICDFVIDKNYQHMGYGTEAIKMGINWLKKKGAKKIGINFRSGNEVAQRTYEKCGFKCIKADFVIEMEYLVTD